MPIFAVVWLVLAAGSGWGGISYLNAASRTNSALHELEGLVGLGFAVVFAGQAILMFGSYGLTSRADNAIKTAKESSRRAVVDRVPTPVRAAAAILREIAERGRVRWSHQDLVIIDFVVGASGGAFTKDDRPALASWLANMPRSPKDISVALDELPNLTSRQKSEFANAGEQLVAVTKSKKVEAQQQLIDRAWARLNG